ncbi:hypothetical protein [Actinocrispum sp. NPDC049592]|uniref:hypothetical protein n=1 Tax=Actinocrispum sp. NPDC049592 TaxID=3154835 RepID=UPI00342B8657
MMTHLAKRAALLTAAVAAAIGLVTVVSPEHTVTVANAAAIDDDDDVPVAQAAQPKEGDIRGHRRILIVDYLAAKDCKVNANYPVNPGGHSWVIRAGAKIAWRFNVTGKVAAVSDPARGTGFPHWGFVEDSSCIGQSTGQKSSYEQYEHGKWVKHEISFPAGQPMPRRILFGRSQFSPFWKAVDCHPDHGSVPGTKHRMTHNRTLRDAPHRFVIGNVYADWEVRPTSVHQDGYTKVYVPSLHRWGWLQL